jgi:hypothetical protein
MITLMVNYYCEDPKPAIASARANLPVDRIVKLHGRYEGFPDMGCDRLDGKADVFSSEHAKRNVMLALAGPPDPDRWLLWLDCDERVIYGSPVIEQQLRRIKREPFGGDVAGVRFIEPLTPRPSLEDPRRGIRDHVIDAFPRLIRHLPGLEYRERHDRLLDGDGRLLVGWATELPMEPEEVDVIVVHLPRAQTEERIAAKDSYYLGPIRQAESRSWD